LIGIDSNILLRWLVDDGADRAQNRAAARILEAETIHVCVVTLLEVLWVLRSRYKIAKPARLDVVERLLGASNVVLQHKDAVAAALADSNRFGGDLPDHLLATLNEEASCLYTLTFDDKATRSPKFKRLTTKES